MWLLRPQDETVSTSLIEGSLNDCQGNIARTLAARPERRRNGNDNYTCEDSEKQNSRDKEA